MKFTEKLLKHPEFLRLQKRVQQIEQDRIYCHHELSHALDVCRMAWMMYLEDQMQEKFESGLEASLENTYGSESALKRLPRIEMPIEQIIFVKKSMNQ